MKREFRLQNNKTENLDSIKKCSKFCKNDVKTTNKEKSINSQNNSFKMGLKKSENQLNIQSSQMNLLNIKSDKNNILNYLNNPNYDQNNVSKSPKNDKIETFKEFVENDSTKRFVRKLKSLNNEKIYIKNFLSKYLNERENLDEKSSSINYTKILKYQDKKNDKIISEPSVLKNDKDGLNNEYKISNLKNSNLYSENEMNSNTIVFNPGYQDVNKDLKLDCNFQFNSNLVKKNFFLKNINNNNFNQNFNQNFPNKFNQNHFPNAFEIIINKNTNLDIDEKANKSIEKNNKNMIYDIKNNEEENIFLKKQLIIKKSLPLKNERIFEEIDLFPDENKKRSECQEEKVSNKSNINLLVKENRNKKNNLNETKHFTDNINDNYQTENIQELKIINNDEFPPEKNNSENFTNNKLINDYQNLSEKLKLKENSMENNECTICENFTNKYSSVKINCKHLLCKKCIKNIIEDRIENKDYFLKCPIYYCSGIFKLKEIKKIIGNKHFQNLYNLIKIEFCNYKNDIKKKLDKINNSNLNNLNQIEDCNKKCHENSNLANQHEFAILKNTLNLDDESFNINENNFLNMKMTNNEMQDIMNLIDQNVETNNVLFFSNCNNYPEQIIDKNFEYDNKKLERKNNFRNFKSNIEKSEIKINNKNLNETFSNLPELNIKDEICMIDHNQASKSNINDYQSEDHLLNEGVCSKIDNLNKSIRSENKLKNLINYKKEILKENNISYEFLNLNNYKKSHSLKTDNFSNFKNLNENFQGNLNKEYIKKEFYSKSLSKKIKRYNSLFKSKRRISKIIACSYDRLLTNRKFIKCKTVFNHIKKNLRRSNFKKDNPSNNQNKKIRFLITEEMKLNESNKMKKIKTKNKLNLKNKSTYSKLFSIGNNDKIKTFNYQPKFFRKANKYSFVNENKHLNKSKNFKNDDYQFNNNIESIENNPNQNLVKFTENNNLSEKRNLYNQKSILNNNIVTINDKSIQKSTMADTMKNFTKKHVFEVSNNETFLIMNKYKDMFCNNCYEPSLYGKLNANYIKCLNCMIKLCRYCMKTYSENHFDLSFIHRCKVYFKKNYTNSNYKKTKRISDLERTEKIKNILINFSLNLLAYILIISFLLKKLNRFLKYKKLMKFSDENYSSVYIVHWSNFLIFLHNLVILLIKIFNFLFWFILSILFLPYYPKLLNIFEYLLN